MQELCKPKLSYLGSGLILEGGGSRGVFTAGVLDYFMEQGLYLPYVVGVSAGACNALDYASAQIGRSHDTFIVRDKELKTYSFKNVIKGKPFYDMDMIFEEYPKKYFPYDFETYKSLKMKLEIGTTDITNGRAAYLSEYEDMDMLLLIGRASSSLPFLAKEVEINGIPYMDGGLSDSIPYGRSIMMGNKKHIVILTRERGYRKSLRQLSAPILKKVYRDRPGLIRAFMRRPRVYNRQLDILDSLEKEGRVFVIAPSEKVVGRTESDVFKLEGFYRHGYSMGAAVYEDVIRYLEN